jgi:hypothetical protein
LQAVIDELESASARLARLSEAVPDTRWSVRADPQRWSVAECVAHLNLTSKAFLPLMRKALGEARAVGGGAPSRFRRDPFGWALWSTMGPPVRFMKTRTMAAFVPNGDIPRATLLNDFHRLQAEQIAFTREADGLPLGKVRIKSPFDARVSYNLYSCLTILSRHQHRHLWQGEQVWANRS